MRWSPSELVAEVARLSNKKEDVVCSKLGLTKEDLSAIKDDRPSDAGFFKLAKGIAQLFGNNTPRAENLTEINNLIIAIAETPDLAPHQEGVLRTANRMLSDEIDKL